MPHYRWYFTTFIIHCLTSLSTLANPSGLGNETVLSYPKTWVADLFYETLKDFMVSGNVGNSACRRQTNMYRRQLQNGSYWAVQMSDSWSRYPTGVLVSTTYQMGVYEECVEVHQPVQGKYCMPRVLLKSATGENFAVGKPIETQMNDPAWREILGFIDHDLGARRNYVKFGICIPDSCTAQDLEVTLQREFDERFLPHRVKAEVKVDPILCSTGKDMYPFDSGFYLTCILFGFIVLMCCLSTTYHLIILMRSKNGKKPSKMPELLCPFSIIHNGKDLLKFDKNNELNLFNGIKVVTMVLVLFGHKFLYFVITPFTYGKQLEMIYKIGPDFLLVCMNLVDPFFYISGYLMYVLLIPEFNKPGTNWYRVPTVIFYKYIKILPPYVMWMLLTTFVIPHMGNGPFWAQKLWPEAEKCKNYWWANILAISNFIKVDNQCLVAGWYISCLLQFMAIGTVVVYIYVKNQKIGTHIIVLLLITSLIIPLIATYVHRAYGIVRVMYSFLENPGNSFEFNELYRPFYLRGIPFYAGLLAGVIVDKMKKREIKFSTVIVYASTFVVTVICVWIQLYGVVFYEINRPYNVIEQSIYSTASHCTWTVILFWITVCHFTSGYGPIEKLFSNRLFVPLGRLSYAVYLVNITIMIMIESRQRAAVAPTTELVIDGWIYGAFRTYLVGILIYFTIEAPFGLFIKKMLYGKKSNDQDTNVTALKNIPETEQKDSTHL